MTIARLTKEEQYKLNLSEKLILFYRGHPCQAAKDLLNIDLTWFQRKILKDLWFKKNNLLLMSRGIGKSWLLALFAVLFAMLYPDVEIGVITPSYKQTEFLFDKISDFYEKSAYFRASVKRYSRTTYKAVVNFNNLSMIEGLPLGTGEKVRGRRYNIILIDEYAYVDETIIKTVIRPMLNVKKPHIENKYIISSTASYTWNHFYMQYLLYNVMSVKKPKQFGLHEYTFEDLKMVDNPPFELDDDIYEMMKMDTTSELYEMENLCLTPCAIMICENEVKKVDSIIRGDKVLSGSGKFEKVTKVYERPYVGDVIRIQSYKNEDLVVTPGHPVLVKRGIKYEYIEAKEMTIDDKLAFRIPLSENKKYDLEKAYLMGLYLAEGNIYIDKRLKKKSKKIYKRIIFSLNQKETECTNRIKEYFENYNKNVNITNHKNSQSREVIVYDSDSNIFSDFEKIGRVSFEKKIPKEVFDWSREAKIEFIKGILDGDGYFNEKFISLDLVSGHTINQLKYLFSQVGVQCSICFYEDKNENHHNVWRLNINSKFVEKVYGWYDLSPYKRKCYRTYGDIDINDEDDQHSWYSIKSISRESYSGLVYNFEIDNDPSYITSVCQLHNCRFPVENVGFFSARLIDQCTPKATETQMPCPIEVFGDKKAMYAMGIDAARVAGGDNFSISILKLTNGIKEFVHGFVLNGAPYQEMIYHIRRLTTEFNIVQINCDSGGGGTTLKDLLMQPYKMIDGKTLPPILDMDDREMEGREGIPILRMVNFTRPVVNDLYMRLKADMQHKTIHFPIDIRAHSDKELERVAREILETKRELLVLQHEGKGNYYVFDVPAQFKKDRATSLALSVQAANDFMSSAQEDIVVELPDGFWVEAV